MLSLRLISRSKLTQYAVTLQKLHTSLSLQSGSSSDSSSSDSDNEKSEKKVKTESAETKKQITDREETNDRLSALLSSMVQNKKVEKTYQPPRPPKAQKRKTPRKNMPFEVKLVDAAKDVATSLGGDVEKTEAALLGKLLSTNNTKKDKKELEETASTPLNLSELLSGMKIDRTESQPRGMPSHMVERAKKASNTLKQLKPEDQKLKKQRTSMESRNLYNGNPLNIFKVSAESETPSTENIPKLTTWDALEEKENNLLITHPPQNIFQEMILWTEQGKLWKFPINNEQGMEKEESVHFSEHVFVERHLQDWCPKRGPIRHFMELVCVGLSKNPYMTVEEKKEHIEWYRDFFGSKQELLKELGAIETDIPLSPKQIEAQK